MFLRAVADQVAVAVERAALADVRRAMAETLQRSLLPGELPSVDRLAVAVRYLPAVEGTQAGGDWFADEVLPRAGLLLAQGVGRLIRRRDDRGVVAVLDRRLATAGYRTALLASLPPLRRSVSMEEVREFFTRVRARVRASE